MISKAEKTQIRQLISSPQWRVLELLVKEYCDKIKGDSIVRDTEWGTIQAALMNEGQIRGITNLLQEIMNSTND